MRDFLTIGLDDNWTQTLFSTYLLFLSVKRLQFVIYLLNQNYHILFFILFSLTAFFFFKEQEVDQRVSQTLTWA